MLCYSCFEQGTERPAVVLCRSCHAGLCIDHLRATAAHFATSHMLDSCHHDTWTATERPPMPTCRAGDDCFGSPIRRLLFVADAAVAEVHDLPAEARALSARPLRSTWSRPPSRGGSPGLPTMWISSATLRTSASTRCSATCGPSAPTPRSAQPRQRPDGHRRCGRGLQARSHAARAAERGARQLAGAWARGAPGEALRPATHQLRSGPARACHRRSTPIACPRRLRREVREAMSRSATTRRSGMDGPPPWSHGMGPSIGCACPSSILPAYSRRLSTPAAADASRWSPVEAEVKRRYLPDTNVLETTFTTRWAWSVSPT